MEKIREGHWELLWEKEVLASRCAELLSRCSSCVERTQLGSRLPLSPLNNFITATLQGLTILIPLGLLKFEVESLGNPSPLLTPLSLPEDKKTHKGRALD